MTSTYNPIPYRENLVIEKETEHNREGLKHIRLEVRYLDEALNEPYHQVFAWQVQQDGMREILKRYDSAETCFFCDPPYTTGTQVAYSTRWDEAEHIALQDILLKIKGTFILTYDDSPFIRDLYGDCNLHAVSQQKGINNKSGKKSRRLDQLIITP